MTIDGPTFDRRRDVEALVKKQDAKPGSQEDKKQDANTRAAEEKLRLALGKSLNHLLDGDRGRFVDNGIIARRMEFLRRCGRVVGLRRRRVRLSPRLRLWSRRRRPCR
jgi:hypothetical protein